MIKQQSFWINQSFIDPIIYDDWSDIDEEDAKLIAKFLKNNRFQEWTFHGDVGEFRTCEIERAPTNCMQIFGRDYFTVSSTS